MIAILETTNKSKRKKKNQIYFVETIVESNNKATSLDFICREHCFICDDVTERFQSVV